MGNLCTSDIKSKW